MDSLAIAFGTTHGVYLTEPKLDLPRVAEIRTAAGIPLVMHGGSGVSREDYKKAIKAGTRKINYFTYMDKAGGNAAAAYVESVKDGEPLFFSSVFMAAREAMKENVKEAMKMFALMD